jgi:hypothetical protein
METDRLEHPAPAVARLLARAAEPTVPFGPLGCVGAMRDLPRYPAQRGTLFGFALAQRGRPTR